MSAIEVSNSSWHARVYLWWYYAKWPKKREYGEKVVGNLCPYVRTVLLWAPCRWLFYQGKLGMVRVAFIAWPLLLVSLPQPLGYLSYKVKHIFWLVDAGLASTILFIAICYVCALILNQFADWADRRWDWTGALERRRRAKKKADADRFERLWEESRTAPPKKKGPSFWSLLGQRISAAHDRICPEIVFRKFEE